MDENLKKIKMELLKYSVKKYTPQLFQNIEGNTLGEIEQNYINHSNNEYNTILPLINDLLNKKYLKVDNKLYHFRSFNNKVLRLDVIEFIKLNGDDDYYDLNEELIKYNIDKCYAITSEHSLERFNNGVVITAEDFEENLMFINRLNQIKNDIKSKNNKINEYLKNVAFLSNSYRICDYTKNMTKDEYNNLIDKINEETKKDLNIYLNILKAKYKNKYVYIDSNENYLKIYKINDIKFEGIFFICPSESYMISEENVSKSNCIFNNKIRINQIVDIVDDETVNEINNLITQFFNNNMK